MLQIHDQAASAALSPGQIFQAALYATLSLAAFLSMVLRGPRYLEHFKDKLQAKYHVRIVASFRHYRVEGPISFLTRMWIEFLIFISHFLVYFSPFVLTGLLGWVLGVFKSS